MGKCRGAACCALWQRVLYYFHPWLFCMGDVVCPVIMTFCATAFPRYTGTSLRSLALLLPSKPGTLAGFPLSLTPWKMPTPQPLAAGWLNWTNQVERTANVHPTFQAWVIDSCVDENGQRMCIE